MGAAAGVLGGCCWGSGWLPLGCWGAAAGELGGCCCGAGGLLLACWGAAAVVLGRCCWHAGGCCWGAGGLLLGCRACLLGCWAGCCQGPGRATVGGLAGGVLWISASVRSPPCLRGVEKVHERDAKHHEDLRFRGVCLEASGGQPQQLEIADFARDPRQKL